MTVRAETEAGFMATVTDYARLNGWLVYHTHDSRRSTAGFPDLVLVRAGVLIFAELKTAKGRVSFEQEEWLAALRETHSCVFLWRPADWPEIERALARTRQPSPAGG